MLACLKGYLLHSLARTPPCRDPIQTRRLLARLAFKMKRKQFEVNVLRGALYSHCDADKLNADTCTQWQTQLKWNRDGAGDEREKEKGWERGRRECGTVKLFSRFELYNLVAFVRVIISFSSLFPFHFSLSHFFSPLLYLFMLCLCFVI